MSLGPADRFSVLMWEILTHFLSYSQIPESPPTEETASKKGRKKKEKQQEKQKEKRKEKPKGKVGINQCRFLDNSRFCR